jgi:hypothetical protein
MNKIKENELMLKNKLIHSYQKNKGSISFQKNFIVKEPNYYPWK